MCKTLLKRNVYTPSQVFDKIIKYSESSGKVHYNCPLGLWGCSGNKCVEASVRQEAYHYFSQYLKDGEYDDFFEQDWCV